jgi:hypothetical protein
MYCAFVGLNRNYTQCTVHISGCIIQNVDRKHVEWDNFEHIFIEWSRILKCVLYTYMLYYVVLFYAMLYYVIFMLC